MPRAPRWNHETRLLAGFVLVALPANLTTALLACTAWGTSWNTGMLVLAVLSLSCALAWLLRRHFIYPLYTLTNLLEALREGDYSLRGSRARRGDAVGEVIWEINALAQTLREQRLALEEKTAQLAKVLAALDSAVLSFDDQGFLSLANPAAERLLARSFKGLDGRDAAALGLAQFLEGDTVRVIDHAFASGSGRWEIRRARFRAEGRAHTLLVISDLSRALREEERVAWQRLLRVLGHELNNSLAPIRSMAETLASMLAREPLPADWHEDARAGLAVIAKRADGLARFMARYTELAKLPPPTRKPVELASLVERIAALEPGWPLTIAGGPACTLEIDPDQIEQALINLLRNAADAVRETGGGMQLAWSLDPGGVRLQIRDDGPGLPPSENLFVPFFTTKPGGSGIGLVLARQIVEGHGGSLSLRNRADAHGCVVELRLPTAE